MRSRIKFCKDCSHYSLKDLCPNCGSCTQNTFPPRFSPEDRYGRFRRMAIYGPDRTGDGHGGGSGR